MNKLLQYVLCPSKIVARIRWRIFSTRLKESGKRTWVGKNFSIFGPEYITIKNDFVGGINLKIHVYDRHNGERLHNTPEVIIGNHVTFTDSTYISCINKVQIGDGVLCGGNVFITDNFHGRNEINELCIKPNDRKLYSKGSIYIGSNVWIGRNVCIMPNVVVGNNCIIGANAVVTKSLPDNCVAAGVPARIIRYIK